MRVDRLLAVLRVQHLLNFGASAAQVEHELARSADDFVGALCNDRNLLNRAHFAEVRVALVLLYHCLHVVVLVLDVADFEDRQDSLGVNIDVVAPDCELL